jgi:hypothetical protein
MKKFQLRQRMESICGPAVAIECLAGLYIAAGGSREQIVWTTRSPQG